jgi:hypothetical protein
MSHDPGADRIEARLRVRVPPPLEGGSYDIHGTPIHRPAATRPAEPTTATARSLDHESETAEDDDAVAIPDPVPGGNEPITRVGPPPEEDRREEIGG